jgi:hypothetical protein
MAIHIKKKNVGKLPTFDNCGNLKCSTCKEYKPIEEFFNCSARPHRHGKDSDCKKCQSIRKAKYWKLKEEFNLELHLRSLLNYCRQRILGHTKRGRYLGMSFDLTLENLLLLYYKQKGLCAISEIEMTFIQGGGKKDINISIDRIDSSKGYTMDNIQLVCSHVNMMKSNLSYERLVFFCENIINKYNNEYSYQESK